MEMAAPVNADKPSWNPLRCGGTGLPTHLVALAKVLILCELWTNQVAGLPDRFLPFLPLFEHLGPPEVFQRTLQALFLVASFGVLFNRRVQASCLLFGLVIVTAMLSSRTHFGNNRFYVGCLLFLIGLYTPKFGPRLIQLQVVILYFGAALNKILLPDWWSGQFFENWVKVLDQQTFMRAAAWLPPLMLSKLAGWFTMAAESALAVGLLVRRWNPWAIWLGIFLYAGMLWFTGSTFTLFFYAGIAAFLAFVDWPKPPLTVLYDGDCGFCEKTKNLFARFDLEGTFEWVPFQKARNLHGISTDALKERLHFVAKGKIYAGYRAFKMMLLYNPLFYLVVTVILLAPGRGDSAFRSWFTAAMILLFFPLFNPLGEWLYMRVAGNRHRIVPGSACNVEAAPPARH